MDSGTTIRILLIILGFKKVDQQQLFLKQLDLDHKKANMDLMKKQAIIVMLQKVKSFIQEMVRMI